MRVERLSSESAIMEEKLIITLSQTLYQGKYINQLNNYFIINNNNKLNINNNNNLSNN